MGIKQVELVPVSATGPSALVPSGKNALFKLFQLSRTETASTLKAVLPAQSTILGFLIYNAVASNAGTTATVSFGTTAANANELVNGQTVIGNAGVVIPTSAANAANLANIEQVPLGADIPIYAKYAETGTVSTLGGPWKIGVWYIP